MNGWTSNFQRYPIKLYYEKTRFIESDDTPDKGQEILAEARCS